MKIIEKIEKLKLVAVIRTDTPEQAYHAANACIRGGIGLIEITFSVPEAHEVIGKLSCIEGIILGAGTVLDIKEADMALKAGASYIVSPHFDGDIIRFTKRQGAVSIPGASTPTEIIGAHRAGGDIIKLFPFVEMGGLKFLKTIRGPLPFIKYMPSGGVTLDNVGDYLDANVTGIIVGSAIIKPELVKAADWKSIEALSRSFIEKLENRQFKAAL